MTPEFTPFPKIARLSREIIVTEKIDGTNVCIFIGDDGEFLAGSRSRWITPESDNHGFARWAYDNKEELLKLGPGRHFGEWWGSGIQRGYGLRKGEKRFSLFNVIRWCLSHEEPQIIHQANPKAEIKYQDILPQCCDVVPIIASGPFNTSLVEESLQILREFGSFASPKFMNPEGVVAWHVAGNFGLKKTIEKDEHPKGQS